MCPSSWKLYLDDFPFFGSSLARLEPEPELFEVWEINVQQISSSPMESTPKLPNFKQLSISKMMGTLVHVQLYTFSYRKPVIRSQNMPKTGDWGVETVKIVVL